MKRKRTDPDTDALQDPERQYQHPDPVSIRFPDGQQFVKSSFLLHNTCALFSILLTARAQEDHKEGNLPSPPPPLHLDLPQDYQSLKSIYGAIRCTIDFDESKLPLTPQNVLEFLKTAVCNDIPAVIPLIEAWIIRNLPHVLKLHCFFQLLETSFNFKLANLQSTLYTTPAFCACNACKVPPYILDFIKSRQRSDICSYCHVAGQHPSCGRCHQAHYCSIQCQSKHWAIHKSSCKRIINLE